MWERRRIGDILVDLQVLTPDVVENVLAAMVRRRDQAKFGQVARDMGLLREEHILAALAVQMELFPGIGDLSFNRLMGRLQNDADVGRPRQRGQTVGGGVRASWDRAGK